jgi:hypothetical protein
MTKNMPYADVLKVYEAATPEQKEILHPVLRRKLERMIKEGQKPDEDDQ